ncbi:nucleotide-binding protein [Cyclobacterium jeungdonense]|uniref:Nucleotide-binding protein n=1 Tax=Cyclobacterium jeungdonense TaxID=708087 RepID=A0ABT8C3Q5_9BACT|nr:nucleotide-binding protein [Cyclobacterium jeungdonense]MDN3687398.1 nucleotide-binding protein [Cyclobacterium jeungdonense]
MKPELFIGSSVEGLSIAEAVETKLSHDFNVTLWTDGVFNLSNTTLEDLLNKLDKSDFGIFIFSPDDITKIRGNEYVAARDNVIYELGLYTGKLGRRNAFIVKPSNQKDFHLPSDLSALYIGEYDTNKLNNPESSVSNFTSKVKRQIISNSEYVLKGRWEFMWQVLESDKYPDPIKEEVDVFHYENTLKFIHTISDDEKYIVKARFHNPYLTGEWIPANGVGYNGSFQMKLNGKGNEFNGAWIGWGDKGNINSGPCKLTKK